MNKDKNQKNDELQTDTKETNEEVSEVVYDSNIDSDNMSDPKEKITSLKEKLKKLTAEKDEYLNGWQRERADFANFKKRTEDDKKEIIKFANESLLEEMLQVLESFDMAFMNKEQWNSVPQNWRVGVEYIHSQLVKILDDNGLREFAPKVGDQFDPKLHVAEELIATTKKDEDNTILGLKKKGYTLNGKIIIAPKVVVGEYKV